MLASSSIKGGQGTDNVAIEIALLADTNIRGRAAASSVAGATTPPSPSHCSSLRHREHQSTGVIAIALPVNSNFFAAAMLASSCIKSSQGAAAVAIAPFVTSSTEDGDSYTVTAVALPESSGFEGGESHTALAIRRSSAAA